MEEPMKSISELAAIYESWATANEAKAQEILASLDSLSEETREQRWSADNLLADAEALKTRAKELRDLFACGTEEEDGPKVPQDRDQCCDGPQAMWLYKRFR